MKRSKSQVCSIWQAWPAPGKTFNSQLGMRAMSAKARSWLPSPLPVRMIVGQAMRA